MGLGADRLVIGPLIGGVGLPQHRLVLEQDGLVRDLLGLVADECPQGRGDRGEDRDPAPEPALGGTVMCRMRHLHTLFAHGSPPRNARRTSWIGETPMSVNGLLPCGSTPRQLRPSC